MGLIRKTASLSTLGAVKYTSKREAQTKAALAQAKLADEQRKTERKARKAEARRARDERWAAQRAEMRERREARRQATAQREQSGAESAE
jgi:hypothetical protein